MLPHIEIIPNSIHVTDAGTQIRITNSHQSYTVGFKMKLQVIDGLNVMPANGSIPPKNSVTVSIQKPTSPDKIQNLGKIHKIFVQFINIAPNKKNSKDIQQLWANLKAKKELPDGSGSIFIPVSFQGIVPEPNLISKSVYNSALRSSSGQKNLGQSILSKDNLSRPSSMAQQSVFSKTNNDPLRDQQLAKSLNQLREKQEELIRKRQQIYMANQNTKPQKKSLKLFIVVIIIGFLIGNWIRCQYTKQL